MRLQNQQLFLLLCVVNTMVAVAFGYSSPLSGYVQGELSPTYTLFTTHFTHHNTQHLMTNLMALWLLLYLFPTSNKSILISFLLCILLTAWYVNETGVYAFVGFSALLYCLPGGYLFQCMVEKKFLNSVIILLILYIYLYMIVPMNSTEISQWLPMTAAHQIGFISGFLIAFVAHQTTASDQPQTQF